MQKSKIEWTDQTWNPVTGCLHKCDYCYARRIAQRFKDDFNDFKPTFHPKRLKEPERLTVPNKIFVCSMADLFGWWVDPVWIEQVISVAKANRQHIFQFLTKNPKRYSEFYFPINCWLGATINSEDDFNRVRELQSNTSAFNKSFISFEPLLSDVKSIPWRFTDWVIIGSMTGPSAIKPKKLWILNIVDDCKDKKIPVFMKNSLADIWDKPLIQEYPKE